MRALDRDLPIIKERFDKLNPGPVNGSIPIMIGGDGEKVTLRIAAEHADIWNTFGDPETVSRKSAVLDEWCVKVDRDPRAIERSVGVNADNPEEAETFVKHGFTHIIVSRTGPVDDLGLVRELISCRDKKNTR